MKSKLLYFVLIMALLVTVAPSTYAATEDTNCPFTIDIKGNDICVETLIKTNFGTTYYTVYLPILDGDPLPMTLGIKDDGIMDINQIQQKARLLWGALFSASAS